MSVTPAHAGVQGLWIRAGSLDSGFRRNDRPSQRAHGPEPVTLIAFPHTPMHLHLHPPATGPRFMDRREALARLAGAIGGTFAAPTLAAMLSACERSGGAADTAAAALSAEQKEMVAAIAEQIIPRTDTPGAREVGVQDFIAEMMEKHYAPEERQRFLAGLNDLDERARKANDASFLDSTPEQRLALLTALDRETFQAPPAPPRPTSAQIRATAEPGTTGSALPPEVAGDSDSYKLEQPEPRRSDTPFWRTMKELTLVGYYTSEPGATQELRHEAIPGRYEACVPLSQIGRAWAV